MLGRQFELEIYHQIQAGFLSAFRGQVFSVGGFVRDFILGRESYDVDMMVTVAGGSEKLAGELKKHFQDQITTPVQMGAMYPIWSFEFKAGPYQGLKIDIADSQKEMFPKSDQRQRTASFGFFAEDIHRRDFTVNMLARDLTTDQIIDESGCGLLDLQNKILRTHPAVDAAKILSDDPLRMIRAVRFSCTHGFNIDQELYNQIKLHVERIQIISAERILVELTKMIKSGNFIQGLELFFDLNVLHIVFSDSLKKLFLDSVLKEQAYRILRQCAQTVSYQFAGLFYFLSRQDTEHLLQRLKLSNALKKEILNIIEDTEKLLTVNADDFLEVREFLRNTELQTADLVSFAKSVTADFQEESFLQTEKKCLVVPVTKKPLLDGHEIAVLLNVSGADIKKNQQLLFKLEDQFVEQNSRAMTKEEARLALSIKSARQ